MARKKKNKAEIGVEKEARKVKKECQVVPSRLAIGGAPSGRKGATKEKGNRRLPLSVSDGMETKRGSER